MICKITEIEKRPTMRYSTTIDYSWRRYYVVLATARSATTEKGQRRMGCKRPAKWLPNDF